MVPQLFLTAICRMYNRSVDPDGTAIQSKQIESTIASKTVIVAKLIKDIVEVYFVHLV